MKATNLDEVLIYFNRQERLTGKQLEYWFVERERTLQLSMQTNR